MKIQTLALALALGLAAAACSPAESSARPATTSSAELLDGRSFAVAGKLPNGETLTSDLSFKTGMFDSSACHAFGYAPGRYTLNRDGDAVKFRAEMANKDGTEVWAGRIAGDQIEGTVTGPDGVAIAFQGRAR